MDKQQFSYEPSLFIYLQATNLCSLPGSVGFCILIDDHRQALGEAL